MTHPLRVGVVGAGRVGAVLAASLRDAGHEIVAAAGESDASRRRIEALLPGTPVAKPSAVARACDLLLLTVPDDMLPNVVEVHDLHATLLHQLGIDHEKLTYRYAGRDFRLTDVHGEVIGGIIA